MTLSRDAYRPLPKELLDRITPGLGAIRSHRDVKTAAAFHLPGLHDQRDHGHRGRAHTVVDNNWMKSHLPQVDRHHTEAAQQYQRSSYTAVNPMLRSAAGVQHPVWADEIRVLDEIFLRAPKLPSDLRVTRNTMPTSFGTSDLHEIVGHTFAEDAFMSTTMRDDGVEEFSWMPVKMNILVPSGVKAVHLSALTSLPDYEHQDEVLLERGAQFIVHDVKKTGAKWEMDVEVLPSIIKKDLP